MAHRNFREMTIRGTLLKINIILFARPVRPKPVRRRTSEIRRGTKVAGRRRRQWYRLYRKNTKSILTTRNRILQAVIYIKDGNAT